MKHWKTMLAAAFSALLCTAGCGLHAAAYDNGDINGDGEINVIDAVILARVLAEDKSVMPYVVGRLDFNLDGTTDTTDLMTMLRYLAGIIRAPEPPAESSTTPSTTTTTAATTTKPTTTATTATTTKTGSTTSKTATTASTTSTKKTTTTTTTSKTTTTTTTTSKSTTTTTTTTSKTTTTTTTTASTTSTKKTTTTTDGTADTTPTVSTTKVTIPVPECDPSDPCSYLDCLAAEYQNCGYTYREVGSNNMCLELPDDRVMIISGASRQIINTAEGTVENFTEVPDPNKRTGARRTVWTNDAIYYFCAGDGLTKRNYDMELLKRAEHTDDFNLSGTTFAVAEDDSVLVVTSSQSKARLVSPDWQTITELDVPLDDKGKVQMFQKAHFGRGSKLYVTCFSEYTYQHVLWAYDTQTGEWERQDYHYGGFGYVTDLNYLMLEQTSMDMIGRYMLLYGETTLFVYDTETQQTMALNPNIDKLVMQYGICFDGKGGFLLNGRSHDGLSSYRIENKRRELVFTKHTVVISRFDLEAGVVIWPLTEHYYEYIDDEGYYLRSFEGGEETQILLKLKKKPSTTA